jgi:hypothetical protein
MSTPSRSLGTLVHTYRGWIGPLSWVAEGGSELAVPLANAWMNRVSVDGPYHRCNKGSQQAATKAMRGGQFNSLGTNNNSTSYLRKNASLHFGQILETSFPLISPPISAPSLLSSEFYISSPWLLRFLPMSISPNTLAYAPNYPNCGLNPQTPAKQKPSFMTLLFYWVLRL